MALPDSSAHRNRRQDEELELRIADSIGTHPMLWGALIAIEADHGYVTLTGVVRTEFNRHLADLLARAQGARGVNNRLRVESDLARQDSPRHPAGE